MPTGNKNTFISRKEVSFCKFDQIKGNSSRFSETSIFTSQGKKFMDVSPCECRHFIAKPDRNRSVRSPG